MGGEPVQDNAISSSGVIDAAAGVSAASHESTGGAGGVQRGAAIFPTGVPMKRDKASTHTFTKKFYFKIYANDWRRVVGVTDVGVIHFATYIPWQALCMYLSPTEYMEILRNSHYAKIRESKFELKFKAIRTPFDANSTDAAEANGNLQFELQRFDGLEHMLPFQAVDFEGRASTTPVNQANYTELITRLYGPGSFNATRAVTDYKWPAVMRERGLSWRPSWNFTITPSTRNTNVTSTGYAQIPLADYVSALPVGEYITDSINTHMVKMSEGYCFNKEYRPKHGLLTHASSAADTHGYTPATTGFSQLNVRTRIRDLVGASPGGGVPPSFPADTQYTSIFGSGAFTVQPPPPRGESSDVFGYGYPNSMNYYSVANLENYTFFEGNKDAPNPHMTSMCLGVVPKVNSDETIVNATLEFECSTSITIDCKSNAQVYFQTAVNPETGAYLSSQITDPINFASRWQHNEQGVALFDDKQWNGDYTIGGLMGFNSFGGNQL